MATAVGIGEPGIIALDIIHHLAGLSERICPVGIKVLVALACGRNRLLEFIDGVATAKGEPGRCSLGIRHGRAGLRKRMSPMGINHGKALACGRIGRVGFKYFRATAIWTGEPGMARLGIKTIAAGLGGRTSALDFMHSLATAILFMAAPRSARI